MDCGNPRCIKVGKWFRRSMAVIVISILVMFMGVRVVNHTLTMIGLGLFVVAMVAALISMLVGEFVHSKKYHITI